MAKNSYILTVSIDKTSLKPEQIENLATEFFGQVVELTSSGKDIDIQFHDILVFGEKVKATECKKLFNTALSSFRTKK